MHKKQEEELHRIALKHKVRDHVSKLIVECPFLFMRKTIENLDLKELDKTNFYHKKLGRYYLKESVLKHIIKNIKKNKTDEEE